jgi:hypothetical protein
MVKPKTYTPNLKGWVLRPKGCFYKESGGFVAKDIKHPSYYVGIDALDLPEGVEVIGNIHEREGGVSDVRQFNF